MLTTVNRQLRRRRHALSWALAVLAVAGVALTARTALMSAHGHGDMSDAVTVCVTVGACVAIAGAAGLAMRRIFQRGL